MKMVSLQQYFSQQKYDQQPQIDYNRLFQEIVDQSSIRNQLDRRKKEEFQYVNKPFIQKKERGNSAGGISINELRDYTPKVEKIKNHRSNSTIQQNRSSSRNNSIQQQYLLEKQLPNQVFTDFNNPVGKFERNRTANNSFQHRKNLNDKPQKFINEVQIDQHMMPSLGFYMSKNKTFYQNNKNLKKNHYLLKTTVKQENQDNQQKARYTSYDQSCFRLQKDYKDVRYFNEADLQYNDAKTKKETYSNDMYESNAHFKNEISTLQQNNSFHQKKVQNTFESNTAIDQQIDNLSDDMSASEYDQLLIDQDQIEKYEKTRMHLKNLVMNKWEKNNERKSKFVDNPQDYLRQLGTLQWAKNHKKDRQKSFNRYKELIECMEFDKDGNPISKKQKEQDKKQAKKHYAPEFIKRIMDVTQLNSAPRQNWAKLNNKLFVTKALMRNLSALSKSSQDDSKEEKTQKAQEELANRLDLNEDCVSLNNEITPLVNEVDMQASVINKNNNNILKQSLSIFSQRSQQKNTISSKLSQEKENLTFTTLSQQQWQQQQQQNKQSQPQKFYINLLNQKQEQSKQKASNKFQNITPTKVREKRTNSSLQNNVTPMKNRASSQKQQNNNNKLQSSNSGSVNNNMKIQYRNTHQEVIKGLDQIINELTGGSK
ncbi:hypothetical protein ABPG74_001156 [Tetrahymena malaccensis]